MHENEFGFAPHIDVGGLSMRDLAKVDSAPFRRILEELFPGTGGNPMTSAGFSSTL
ncbi:hypothetical protein [Planobispora rosea]|nr:hypothetical protein [Planobispora rosea]